MAFQDNGRKKSLPEWTYNKEEVQAHVDRQKDCREPVRGWSEVKGKKQTKERKEDLVFSDEPAYPVSMKIHVTGTGNMVESYRSAFILSEERIRGIDYCPVKNRRFFSDEDIKEVGWHENVLYYDLRKGKIENEHNPLTETDMTAWITADLVGFFDFSCKTWNINPPEEERRLL